MPTTDNPANEHQEDANRQLFVFIHSHDFPSKPAVVVDRFERSHELHFALVRAVISVTAVMVWLIAEVVLYEAVPAALLPWSLKYMAAAIVTLLMVITVMLACMYSTRFYWQTKTLTEYGHRAMYKEMLEIVEPIRDQVPHTTFLVDVLMGPTGWLRHRDWQRVEVLVLLHAVRGPEHRVLWTWRRSNGNMIDLESYPVAGKWARHNQPR